MVGKERQRIARELHDTLEQQLAALLCRRTARHHRQIRHGERADEQSEGFARFFNIAVVSPNVVSARQVVGGRFCFTRPTVKWESKKSITTTSTSWLVRTFRASAKLPTSATTSKSGMKSISQERSERIL